MIESGRMRLKKATHQDVSTLQKWWNDGALMESVGFPKGLDISEEKVKKTLDKKNHAIMIAFDKEDGTPIGEFSYGQIDIEEGTARVGLKIANLKYQGRGYGKEGLEAFLEYLFMTYALEAVLIDTFTENKKARSLYEAFGAETESVEKDYWTNPDGKSFDVVFYRITKERFDTALSRR